VVVLRYIEDLTEILTAEVLDCSVGTVKSWCRRQPAPVRGHARSGRGGATPDG
jgi:DNA-directed RNA polymerase specialized sigma24 family protein